MQYVGTGARRWRVRVDLFVHGGDSGDGAQCVRAAAGALRGLVTGEPEPGDVGADEGTGIAGRPVVGLVFWVAADNVGDAARLAVDTAQRATATADGSVAELYDVTVIPERAVARPGDPEYPPLPD